MDDDLARAILAYIDCDDDADDTAARVELLDQIRQHGASDALLDKLTGL